jgi:putative ABC transport system permease protein
MGYKNPQMSNKKHLLVRFFESVLRVMLDEDAFCERTGDIQEVSHAIFREKGKLRATLWHIREAGKAVPRFLKESIRWRAVMFKNYIKIAFRNIKRHKGYSLLTITGLTVGMACFILISLFVRWELSFDRFHKNGDRIHRIIVENTKGTFNYGKTTMGVIPSPMAESIAEEFPEVNRVTRVHRFSNALFIHEEKKFEENGLLADENFLKIFSFPLLEGDAATALQQPLSMVISKELGKKIFGSENPMGKSLDLLYREKFSSVKITGVLEKNPQNSHLKFDYLISLLSWKTLREERYKGRWNNFDAFIYVELKQGADPKALAAKLPALYEKHTGDTLSSHFVLQPLKSIHLKSDAFIEISENYRMTNIYIFTCIAFVILFTACINYINLVTARASKRAREVGIRKVLGAPKKQLIRQFLGESVFFSFAAFTASLVLVLALFPAFRVFINRPMELHLFSSPAFFLGIAGLVLLVGIAAGLFPAFFLSAFHPVQTLKGHLAGHHKKFNVRKILVVFQFSISIALIASTLIILRQMNFIRTRNMGFDRDLIYVVRFKGQDINTHLAALKSQLLQNPAVTGASYSWYLPTDIEPRMGATVEKGALPEFNDRISSYYCVADQDFLDVYGLTLLSGRSFSSQYANEADEAVILNETAVRLLGWKEPLGKMCRTLIAKRGRVIGVVKDFHFHSLHRPIEPLIMHFVPNEGRYLSLKIRPENLKMTVSSIKKIIDAFKFHYPPQYFFLDDSFNDIYQDEQKQGHLFGLFSGLAVFISCLGLFGLACFSLESRTKEIGIRKVLGASHPGIFYLLTREFFKWVLVANIIAWPTAYFAMNTWLQNFAYRRWPSIWIFAISGGTALMIALLTVSFQSIKAAASDPVKSLRYE